MATALLIGSVCAAAANECASPSTTAEQVECASQAYDEADADLNDTYQRVRQTLKNYDQSAGDKGDREGKLVIAQRAWIAYRDARCDLKAAAAFGGTLAPVLRISCLADLTEERTKELKDLEGAIGP